MIYDSSSVERKWQKVWQAKKIYEPDFKNPKKPFYNLMMFPYPSAEGLHIGNMYAFTGSDIYGRFKRMRGYDVFEPMGLDGFGIHSENYALKIGEHPQVLAKRTEKNFYRQLSQIGNGFAWEERLETYKPEYYKWTQWIFIQLFKKGLAYRAKAPVNWCPSCRTVLADEQVIVGKCERCGSAVSKKELEQWFFRITRYADKLLANLDKLDWSEKVKIAQRSWIGRSEGAEIEFRIKNQRLKVEVFTTRPDTLFGATYLILSPEHTLIENLKLQIENWDEVRNHIEKSKSKSDDERIAEGREKTGVELKGVKAVNPANGEEIPVWVSDYVLGGVGTGAIMAVPAHDQRDFEFARKFNLPIKMVVCPRYPETTCPILDEAYEGEGYLVGSGKFDGMKSGEAKKKITESVGGRRKVKYRLRDWLISRQRYWGPPIPMILCEKCGWQPVPEKDLPIKLPYVKNFRPTGTGKSPLAPVESFYKTKCPKCGGKARRETDVSDTFLDSAWYYLGYLILNNPKYKIQNINPIVKKWLPVNMYIGGAEHSVLHLLYSRFLAMVLKDLGLVSFEEPFTKFRAHGLIIREGAKMSKSKGNVINPDDYVKKFGADALRMALMFLGPFEEGGDFRDSALVGIVRFLEKVYKLKSLPDRPASPELQRGEQAGLPAGQAGKIQDKLLHQTIRKVTEDIESLRYNTAISALMILVNEMAKQNHLSVSNWQAFLKLLAPFAPHLAEEMWQSLGNRKSIHLESWPSYNPRFTKEAQFDLIIQVNGKTRDKVMADFDIKGEDAKLLAVSRPKIQKLVKDGVKKAIFVKNRLINLIV